MPKTTLADRDLKLRKAYDLASLPAKAVLSGREVIRRALFGPKKPPPKR